MRWIDSCDCPFCGDDMWECEHLVLDLGGGGEDGGVGLRAWGGLETRAEMLDALLTLIKFAWGESLAPSESSAVRARLDALTLRLPFGAEDWWRGRYNVLDAIVEEIASDGNGAVGPGDDREHLLAIQISDDGDAEEGSLLESIWLDVMRRILEDVPSITVGDCDIMSMTAGLYYLVWAEDPAAAEQAIAAPISLMATAICEAVVETEAASNAKG